MDELFSQISLNNSDLGNTLTLIKQRELEISADKARFCIIFPFEESLKIISEDSVNNIIKSYLLYFIGYFALCDDLFPLKLFIVLSGNITVYF